MMVIGSIFKLIYIFLKIFFLISFNDEFSVLFDKLKI